MPVIAALASARDTAREIVGGGWGWLPVAWLVVLVLAAPAVAGLSMGDGGRGLRDVFLTLLWLGGSAAGGALGVRSGAGLRRQRPRDLAVVVGHQLGAVGVAGVGVAVGVAGFALVAAWHGHPADGDLAWLGLLLWLELAVTAGMGALLATRLPPPGAVALTAALWILGHLSGPHAALIPDLSAFDVQDRVMAPEAVALLAGLAAVAYGGAWVGALLALTALSLKMRDVP